MAALLGCSGFFSAAETAFFHLSGRGAGGAAGTKHGLDKLVAGLLKEPNRLLTSLLLGNMLVNVLFFSLAGVLAVRVQERYGGAAGAVCGILCFMLVLLFGEMLPKSVAYANARGVSLVASAPIYVCTRVFVPVITVIDWIIVKPVVRLLAHPAKVGGGSRPITINQLKLLLEGSERRGLLSADQNQLLLEALEFGFLKVRNVMRPRVEMAACSLKDKACDVRGMMQQRGLRKMPVYKSEIDSIVGLVYLRDLVLEPDAEVEKLLREALFVPEQKTVESLVEFFRRQGDDFAVAVDEYGGIAGSVSLEDVVEQLLGPVGTKEGTELIKQLGPMKYRLSAGLSIHDWSEAFGVDPEQIRLTTLGGLVTALLGKIPKAGDTTVWQNMKFTVESVNKNRIERLILSLEPMVKEK